MPRTAPRPESNPGPQTEDDRLKADLSSRYDKLNALWKKAEDQLRQFMVPAEVVFEFRSYIDSDSQEDMHHDLYTREAIGWARTSGNWRLCVGYAHDRHGDGFSWTPITEASLETRTECVAHFAKLREKVIERAKQTIPELDKAITSLSEALN